MGWSNEVYFLNWHEVTASPGRFEGVSHESFETRWRQNERYVRDWTSVIAQTARFQEGNEEAFEQNWTPARTI